ncbi:MAG: hypothetical protein HYZ10_01330 [Ignavibacteriales bacterium]|nr:hypothetical protein [Ignavibacteriales bacterium]
MKATILFFALLCFSFAEILFAQDSSQNAIIVKFISYKCIDTTFIVSKRTTHSYPSQDYYEIDKFVYELNITLELDGNNFVFNKPLALTCYLPKGGEKTIIINEELEKLISPESYTYIMLLETKQKGWAKITAGEWDAYNLRVTYSSGIKFVDDSFYIK